MSLDHTLLEGWAVDVGFRVEAVLDSEGSELGKVTQEGGPGVIRLGGCTHRQPNPVGLKGHGRPQSRRSA